jgi:hypothetical protein
MTHEDQVFIVDVMVATSVISRPEGAATKFNAIVKVCKYRGLHEKHHFIPMAMEVHGTPGCDMDRFIKKCVYLSTINNQEIINLVCLHLVFQVTR